MRKKSSIFTQFECQQRQLKFLKNLFFQFIFWKMQYDYAILEILDISLHNLD